MALCSLLQNFCAMHSRLCAFSANLQCLSTIRKCIIQSSFVLERSVGLKLFSFFSCPSHFHHEAWFLERAILNMFAANRNKSFISVLLCLSIIPQRSSLRDKEKYGQFQAFTREAVMCTLHSLELDF